MGLMDECDCNGGNATSNGFMRVKEDAHEEKYLTMCNLCHKQKI
jgi:hypothetical protein